MEKLELFRPVGEVDDDILEDTEAFLRAGSEKRPAPAWVKWGSLAACAAVAVCAAWALRSAGEPGQLPDVTPPPPETAQSTPNEDRPAVEPAENPEELTRPAVELRFNELDKEPDMGVTSLFALMLEDFVPMTREELLDYYGVSLPVEELLPDLSAVGPEEGDGFGRGIYRRGDVGAYFDTNTFSFESADGMLGVNVTLDKAFHLPSSPWELPGDELRFTSVNGWELALFLYPDEEGNQYYRTEFRQNGVNYCVTGKNMAEQAFAVILESLLEERSDFAPGEVRTVTGTYTGGLSRQTLGETQPDGSTKTEVSYRGPLGLTLEDGSGLLVELTPEQAEELHGPLSLDDRVTVTFTGEPATIGTVWPQQLVSIDSAE